MLPAGRGLGRGVWLRQGGSAPPGRGLGANALGMAARGRGRAGGVGVRSMQWQRAGQSAPTAGAATSGAAQRGGAGAGAAGGLPPASAQTAPRVPLAQGRGGAAPPAQPTAQVLVRVGRSKLRPLVTRSKPAGPAGAPSPGAGAGGLRYTGSAPTPTAATPRQRAALLAVRNSVQRLRRLPQPTAVTAARTGAMQGGGLGTGGATGNRNSRTLKLVTVGGQQFYSATGADGNKRLHSVGSVAGKAAAAKAAAKAAAARSAGRRQVAAGATVAAGRVLRSAVWRRRLSSAGSGGVAAGGRDPRLGVRAGGVRKLLGGTAAAAAGSGGVAQRILAKARMRRAASKATKARGYCPEYCRCGSTA